MRLTEIRDLDGPNLFLLEPAIKIEIAFEPGDDQTAFARKLDPAVDDLPAAARSFITHRHEQCGVPIPAITARQMDDETSLAIAFGWTHRSFGMAVAQNLVDALNGVVDDNTIVHLRYLAQSVGPDDRPSMIRDADRSALAISVTGTNGKTTTTRLIAHIMRSAGHCTGWNSSSGIYIDGVEIEEGDYSGPSGARRVLEDPSVQVAVLETARGGILLRGLGYEHNDVSVFTNISPDHLDLQGVRTLGTLAEVKAVVCRVTSPNGHVVANADDQYVMAAVATVQAPLTLFSRNPDQENVVAHQAGGGRTVLLRGNAIDVTIDRKPVASFPLADIPMTFEGRAIHMVENAMAAIGASFGAGLTVAAIREGLRSFQNDASHNPGRLNVYECAGTTVIVDFAHNEAGVKHLVDFGNGFRTETGKLITIIGTAGDRTDQSLFEIGRIAAEESGVVIAKGTVKYLRGRSLESLMERYRAGAASHPATPYRESESEVTALNEAFALAEPGDVIVMMVQEHTPEIESTLAARCHPKN